MIQILIQPTADLVHSLVADTDDQETMALWHGREVPEVAARRLDVYVERVESLIRERWPADELDVTITSEQIRTGGATRPIVYAVDHDHDEDPQEALEEISGRAWMAACEAQGDEMATEMRTETRRYVITNRRSGVCMGVFVAVDETDAYRAMLRDAGHDGTEEPSDALDILPIEEAARAFARESARIDAAVCDEHDELTMDDSWTAEHTTALANHLGLSVAELGDEVFDAARVAYRATARKLMERR